ncbi:sigma-54 dependent transcriptional regulator [Aliiroseovarius sp. S1339]|uniref:sigma-54-dependent transcriptional regulator n=1 Tax=Aliiroseovarius sp. S1339 TaxID=2936990 RepID=UPI0020C13600|nr:sigma-54 dependent transcriptional regulator [Aliiroseovarius sp. S1339]MCK8463063.1 sigma-54 dependent transcriptional regulator [Aliiroseovarius sp. S1339]
MDERNNPSTANLTAADPNTDSAPPLAMVLAPPDIADLFPATVFDDLECQVAYANSISEAKVIADDSAVDIIVLPLRVNNRNVLPLIRDLLKRNPDQAIIVVSQSDEINDAAEAMRLGALDCIFVPFTQNRLQKTVANALKKVVRRAMDPVSVLKTAKPATRRAGLKPASSIASVSPDEAWVRHGMVLSDLSMKPVLHALDTIAPSDAPVFIEGETGTGKELLARALHAESGRSAGPFVVINCARLEAGTLTKQLFSDHRNSAGCGASAANGGTLFLDEIARTDLRVQKQLMRFLDSREIAAFGTVDAAKVDARIICTSTENARAEINAGRLREDLYYRLHVVPISLPALRDRGGDILAIANNKLAQTSRQEGRRFRGFTSAAADILKAHPWPGNVRQLINVIWNIVLHHDSELVTADMLPVDLLAEHPVRPQTLHPEQLLAGTGLLGRSLADIERVAIEETIRSQGGSIPRAAQILDVSPSTIYRKRESWARG